MNTAIASSISPHPLTDLLFGYVRERASEQAKSISKHFGFKRSGGYDLLARSWECAHWREATVLIDFLEQTYRHYELVGAENLSESESNANLNELLKRLSLFEHHSNTMGSAGWGTRPYWQSLLTQIYQHRPSTNSAPLDDSDWNIEGEDHFLFISSLLKDRVVWLGPDPVLSDDFHERASAVSESLAIAINDDALYNVISDDAMPNNFRVVAAMFGTDATILHRLWGADKPIKSITQSALWSRARNSVFVPMDVLRREAATIEPAVELDARRENGPSIGRSLLHLPSDCLVEVDQVAIENHPALYVSRILVPGEVSGRALAAGEGLPDAIEPFNGEGQFWLPTLRDSAGKMTVLEWR